MGLSPPTKVKCPDDIGREIWVMGRAVSVEGSMDSIQSAMLAPLLYFSVAYGIGAPGVAEPLLFLLLLLLLVVVVVCVCVCVCVCVRGRGRR